VVVLPATSVAWIEIEFGPCISETVQANFGPEIVAAAPLHVTPVTPDKESLSEPITVMDVVLRLIVWPLGGDVIVKFGGALSRFTVTDVLAVFPALSVVVPKTSWFFPSVVTV
jgi:hypothetical protein